MTDDSNPVLQSVIDTARELYPKLGRSERIVSCSLSLLQRGDAEPQDAEPFTRLKAWADKGGLGVLIEGDLVQVTVRRKPLYACQFSEDRVYRYTLTDLWDGEKPMVALIGLNPSTADEFQLDPTLKRIRKWCQQWGFGAFTMLNLFAFRSPHPKVMQAHPEPIGERNDFFIRMYAMGCQTTVVCWGAGGEFKGRAKQVLDQIPYDPMCLGFTSDGFPIHPMARGKHRLPDALQLRPFNGR